MSSLTPREARTLLKKHKGVATQAALAAGIPRSTFRELLYRDGAAKVAAPKQEEPKKETAIITKLEASLRAARNTPTEPIIPAKPVKREGREKVRVIIPDSHGDHISRPAAAAFLADLKYLNPDEVIMLGDHLDCGGFLAQHHTMGFVAETETSFEADVIAANAFLNEVQKAAPSAKVDYLEGNHDQRIEKWCVTQALRNRRDSQFLLDTFSPRAVLGLKNRGIKYYETSGRYDGLSIPGTIKRGQCYFTHGISHGRHATHTHVTRFGASVVHGHTHRAQSSIIRIVDGGVIGAWCPGTLSKLQPLYLHTSPSDWCHGYGVQFVQPSGKFLHVNVLISGGMSLLPSQIRGA